MHWDDLIHSGGEIPYAYVLKAVEDESRHDQLMIFLSDNRPSQWVSERLYITT